MIQANVSSHKPLTLAW